MVWRGIQRNIYYCRIDRPSLGETGGQVWAQIYACKSQSWYGNYCFTYGFGDKYLATCRFEIVSWPGWRLFLRRNHSYSGPGTQRACRLGAWDRFIRCYGR